MADTPTAQLLRGLVLSATELKAMTDWPDALVEDYLTLLDNLITLSDILDTKQNILIEVINVSASDSPFTVTDVDQEYIFDTTGGDIVVNLKTGTVGRKYRMSNVGTAGNKVEITPNGLDLLFGDNLTSNLYDAETFIMTYSDPKGWW